MSPLVKLSQSMEVIGFWSLSLLRVQVVGQAGFFLPLGWSLGIHPWEPRLHSSVSLTCPHSHTFHPLWAYIGTFAVVVSLMELLA